PLAEGGEIAHAGCVDCATIKMTFGRGKCVPPTPGMRWYSQEGSSAGRRDGGKMRVKPARGGSNVAPSARRLGAIARRSAILLSGTAAVALSIAQPARAIVVNDQVAAAVGGIANYTDAGNQFPNVVSLFSPTFNGSGCTGSLINSRTILTAAHCFDPNSTPT